MRASDPLRVQRVGPVVTARWADWQWSYDLPRPGDQSLGWLCRYAPDALTPNGAMALAGLVSQEWHLAAHPAGTESTMRQLRCIRRGYRAAVRFVDEERRAHEAAVATERVHREVADGQ